MLSHTHFTSLSDQTVLAFLNHDDDDDDDRDDRDDCILKLIAPSPPPPPYSPVEFPVQRKMTSHASRIVPHGLFDDPAFSADPHHNPLFMPQSMPGYVQPVVPVQSITGAPVLTPAWNPVLPIPLTYQSGVGLQPSHPRPRRAPSRAPPSPSSSPSPPPSPPLIYRREYTPVISASSLSAPQIFWKPPSHSSEESSSCSGSEGHTPFIALKDIPLMSSSSSSFSPNSSFSVDTTPSSAELSYSPSVPSGYASASQRSLTNITSAFATNATLGVVPAHTPSPAVPPSFSMQVQAPAPQIYPPRTSSATTPAQLPSSLPPSGLIPTASSAPLLTPRSALLHAPGPAPTRPAVPTHGSTPELRTRPPPPADAALSRSVSAPLQLKPQQQQAQVPGALQATRSRRPSVSAAAAPDLDRVDELDETDPRGLGWHHDGPYEAIKRGLSERDVPDPPPQSHSQILLQQQQQQQTQTQMQAEQQQQHHHAHLHKRLPGPAQVHAQKREAARRKSVDPATTSFGISPGEIFPSITPHTPFQATPPQALPPRLQHQGQPVHGRSRVPSEQPPRQARQPEVQPDARGQSVGYEQYVPPQEQQQFEQPQLQQQQQQFEQAQQQQQFEQAQLQQQFEQAQLLQQFEQAQLQQQQQYQQQLQQQQYQQSQSQPQPQQAAVYDQYGTVPREALSQDRYARRRTSSRSPQPPPRLQAQAQSQSVPQLQPYQVRRHSLMDLSSGSQTPPQYPSPASSSPAYDLPTSHSPLPPGQAQMQRQSRLSTPELKTQYLVPVQPAQHEYSAQPTQPPQARRPSRSPSESHVQYSAQQSPMPPPEAQHRRPPPAQPNGYPTQQHTRQLPPRLQRMDSRARFEDARILPPDILLPPAQPAPSISSQQSVLPKSHVPKRLVMPTPLQPLEEQRRRDEARRQSQQAQMRAELRTDLARAHTFSTPLPRAAALPARSQSQNLGLGLSFSQARAQTIPMVSAPNVLRKRASVTGPQIYGVPGPTPAPAPAPTRVAPSPVHHVPSSNASAAMWAASSEHEHQQREREREGVFERAQLAAAAVAARGLGKKLSKKR